MLQLIRPTLLSLILLAFLASAPIPAHASRELLVRVTTSAYVSKGWERHLVAANPNLSHFCWMPVYGYGQGRQRIIQAKGPDIISSPARQISRINKPIHIPTPLARTAVLPNKNSDQTALKWSTRQNNVSARLERPVIAMYPGLQGRLNLPDASSLVQGSLSSQSLYGRLR